MILKNFKVKTFFKKILQTQVRNKRSRSTKSDDPLAKLKH